MLLHRHLRHKRWHSRRVRRERPAHTPCGVPRTQNSHQQRNRHVARRKQGSNGLGRLHNLYVRFLTQSLHPFLWEGYPRHHRRQRALALGLLCLLTHDRRRIHSLEFFYFHSHNRLLEQLNQRVEGRIRALHVRHKRFNRRIFKKCISISSAARHGIADAIIASDRSSLLLFSCGGGCC